MSTTVSEAPTWAERRVKQQDFAQRYQQVAAGNRAEEELVEEYLPLVKTVVGRIAMSLPAHVDINDLHSAGLVGLLQAVRQFDPQGGSSFESYARVRIRGNILDELRRLDWVPRSVHTKARRVQVVIQRLEQMKGSAPTDAEIAQALNLSVTEFEELMVEIRPATFICLDAAQSEDESGGTMHHEVVADTTQTDPAEHASRRELARIIAERLEELPETQRKVLALYYFEGLRLREIAEVFRVTESRICQIHSQAVLSLKAYLNKRGALSA
ncbi:MAG: FliA/WhiG family RNA polymerase sigma factor [Limisphaerales bacterium]